MSSALRRVAERIDAASLRERALVFLAAALVFVLFADTAFLGPLRARQAKLSGEVRQFQAEMKTIQTELQRLAVPEGSDPDAAARRRIEALRAELAELDARIAEHQRRFTAPERVREVLDELLARNRALSLVELKTLPAAPLGEGARVFRHGVELIVRGRYLDLYEYLAALERLPTQLYWGRVELEAAGNPLPVLRLTVYTVSFDKAWLVV